jgi:predicted DNA-binding transcriptional regulator AlpA
MPKAKGPTREEIRAAYADVAWRAEFPPVLSPARFARLIGMSTSTIYSWISDGRLDGAHRKRGKHQFIWRDSAIDLIFNGPEWSEAVILGAARAP